MMFDPPMTPPNSSFVFDSTVAVDKTWPGAVRQLGPITLYANGANSTVVSDVTAKLTSDVLEVTVAGKSYKFAADQIASAIHGSGISKTVSQPAVEIAGAPGISLLVFDANGENAPVARVDYMTFWLIISKS